MLVIPVIVNSTVTQLEEKRALREVTQGLAGVAIISTRGVSDVSAIAGPAQALMPWWLLFMVSVAVTIALAIVVCAVVYLRQRARRLSTGPLSPRYIDVDTRRQPAIARQVVIPSASASATAESLRVHEVR